MQTKLAKDEKLPAWVDIDVATHDGVVTLSGSVDTPDLRRRAEETTRSVAGVVRVRNNIRTSAE